MGIKLTNSASLALCLTTAAVFSAVTFLKTLPVGQELPSLGLLGGTNTAALAGYPEQSQTATVSQSLLSAITTSGDPTSMYTVTFRDSQPTAEPALLPYSFQTSLADPDEPIVYTVNGEQITLDEFYVFQRKLAKERSLYEEQRVADAADQHAYLLTILDERGIVRNDTSELVGRDFQTHTLDAIQQIVARLTADDIKTLSDRLEDNSIQIKLYTEPVLNGLDQSRLASVDSTHSYPSEQEGLIQKQVFAAAIPLFAVLFGIYLMTFRSLRQFRVM